MTTIGTPQKTSAAWDALADAHRRAARTTDPGVPVGVDDPGIEPLIALIRPAIVGGCHDVACAVPAHVTATVSALANDPGPLGIALRDGRVTVLGAVVDIVDGSLTHLTV